MPEVCFEPSQEVEVEVDIVAEQTCALWNSLDQLSGRTVITRNGESLQIDFEDGVVFTGTVIGPDLILTYRHEHPFTDGCTWQALETLSGTMNPDDCEMELDYSYVESVVGSDFGCATPCGASGDINLSIRKIIVD